MIPLETTNTGFLDIQKLVVKNPESTFFFRVKGDALIKEHLQDGDILVVDRSILPFETALVVVCFRPPLSIINAPTKWMKQEGFGIGYQYDHDYEHGYSGQTYFPDQVPSQEFYQPVERGFERELTKRLAYFCYCLSYLVIAASTSLF